METLTKPAELNRDTVQTLDEIRAGADNPLFGAAPAAAEELFGRHIQPLLEGSGMPGLQVMHYGWFLRELARLWRKKTGRDLAFHLELCIRKWLNLGLESNTVQFLVCEAHQRLKAVAASATVTEGGEMMPPDRRRLTAVDRAASRYARTLRQRTNPCPADGNGTSQIANFRRALERTELRAEQVRQVLLSLDVPPSQYVAYRNFGLHLDKLIRDHSGETLRTLAASAVARWTCYGLQSDVLSAICVQVFGLVLP